MAFERPTLSELVERIEQDFVSRLDRAGAVLRRAIVYVLARVLAGAAHMMHGHLEYLSKQMFPDISDEAFLLRQGALFGITRTSPVFAQGTVTVTGTNGTDVPAGTVLLRSDGTEYTTDSLVTIGSGTATPSVTASVASADGTLVVAMELTFESPIAHVDSVATVASSTVDGSDEEDIEDYRIRVLERTDEPPHGGNDADYVAWAKEVSGVTRAWVTPLGLGPGTVLVRFVRDDDVSPIPDAGEVAAVQAKLDEEAPAHATVTVAAPVAAPLALTIALTPNTSATRAAVTAELEDFLARTAEPGVTTLVSQIDVAIGTAAGVTNFVRTVPAADVTHTDEQLATLGTITWL